MLKKRFSLFLALCFFALATSAQEISVWKLADLKRNLDSASTPTVVNFWATFCKPCIAEIPHFQKLAAVYKKQGVNFVFVSLDLKDAYPKKIAAFTRRLKLTEKVAFLDETNADLFCPAVDSSWTGSIPATIFVHPGVGYRRFLEEELSEKALDAEIKRMLHAK